MIHLQSIGDSGHNSNALPHQPGVGEDLVFRAVNAGLVLTSISKKIPKNSEAQKLPTRHRSNGLSITPPPPYVVNYKAEGDIL